MSAISPADLPVIGAALDIRSIDSHLPWLFERQRDLEIQDFCHAELLSGDWKSVAEAYKAKLAGFGGRVGIHGPFWGLPTASIDPDIRAVVSRRMLQAMDTAEWIGATHMVVHSPFTTWDYNNLPYNPKGFERIVALTQETLSAAVRRAEDIGLTLVIENIEDIDPASRVTLAQSFNSSSVKVSLDTGHAHYAHGSNGAPPVDYYVTAAGNTLAHVHVQDADGYADRHWRIGTGTVNWYAVFAALEKLESNPRLILEMRNHADTIPSAEYLARLGLAQ